MRAILLMSLITLVQAHEAKSQTFSLGGKLGHQSARLESGAIRGVETSSVTDAWGREQAYYLSSQTPFQTGLKNGPVAGLRMNFVQDYWGFSGEFDYAQFSAQPGSTLKVFGVGGAGEINLIKHPKIRVFGLLGLRINSIETSRDLRDDFIDQVEIVKTEPIWTLNRDWGAGLEIPVDDSISLGFNYRRSESILADGEYRQVIRRTDSMSNRIVTSETRADYKDFRYKLEEFTLSINLKSKS